VFGAVFFVSVGMLLDPSALVSNFGTIIFICLMVITGMIATLTIGSILTGQPIAIAISTAFSMAQIGEFSFIIAAVGLSLNAINPLIYPIIVAVSLITIFLTPYLIRLAPKITTLIESNLRAETKISLERFHGWSQRQFPQFTKDVYESTLRWIANGIVVITIFIISESKLLPLIARQVSENRYVSALSWVVTFAVASPFVWAMFTSFDLRNHMKIMDIRKQNALRILVMFGSRALTVLIIGALSTEFFSVKIAIAITAGICLVIFASFRRKIGIYYHTIETIFISGIGRRENQKGAAEKHAHLVPWDAHLAELVVNPLSSFRGLRLLDVQIRERFGVNIIVISRHEETIVAPKATEMIFPNDIILCFGTDEQLGLFSAELNRPVAGDLERKDNSNYALRQVEINQASIVTGKSIKDSGIRDVFNCMVVGIERSGARIQSPESTLVLKAQDSLWVVGELTDLTKLKDTLCQ
jgi:CPA2 family monovalent cation:H+ antiporter-2